MNDTAPITVLLVESDPAGTGVVGKALAEVTDGKFRVESATRLDDAVARLQQGDIAVVLLAPMLADADGAEALRRIVAVAPEALVLPLDRPLSRPPGAPESAAAVTLTGGNAVSWLPPLLHYVHERKSAESLLRAMEEALLDEQERWRIMLDSIADAVMTTDILGKVTEMNPVAEAMTGWARADSIGRPVTEVFQVGGEGSARPQFENPVAQVLAGEKESGRPTRSSLVRRDGIESTIENLVSLIRGRDGKVSGTAIVFRDISETRFMALKLAHLAQHDLLTGLPNRELLTERIAQAIGLAHRHHKKVALLSLDLDYFKHINDSLGQAIGDELLKSAADRLQSAVRSTDSVCRQGGDEFVILLAEIEDAQDAVQVAETLRATLATAHRIGEHELHVTVSIGISIYPDDGLDAVTVIQHADTAMYHAKESGRDAYQFFKAEMNTRAVQRLQVENKLRRGLRQGEFVLHYQPKIDLASDVMTGAEALIRWLDPDLGLVYPNDFIPVAEQCGLIVPIGQWVLREACRQVQSWLSAGLPAVPVAVNISALEFRQKGFLEGVAAILAETGLAPRYLELELTESFLMEDADASTAVLGELKDLGVKLAIDDFGTGYSSLSYLKRFPVDTLKIDQSFVRDIATDTDDATIVSAVIGMGRNLKQRVVAEGVETREQLAFLRTQQCDEGQGFQFSQPLSAEAFKRLLGSGNNPRFPRRRG